MAFCREKNQKLLFKVDSLLKFRKWFKYGLKTQKLQKQHALYLCFTLRPAIFNSATRR